MYKSIDTARLFVAQERLRTSTFGAAFLRAAALAVSLAAATPALPAGVTQTQTEDTPQHFGGILFHGAPVLVPDPNAPPGTMYDDHPNVFGQTANWPQETQFTVRTFGGNSGVAGATGIRHAIAPHGEARTRQRILSVSTLQQVFPIPGLPGFALGIDIDGKRFAHGDHTDTYGMLLIAGFVQGNVTGYLGFLSGAHTVAAKKMFYVALGPDDTYAPGKETETPPFGGAVISLAQAEGEDETDFVMIAVMGVAPEAIGGATLYSGSLDEPGDVLMQWEAGAFSSGEGGLGSSLVAEIDLPTDAADIADSKGAFLALETRAGPLVGIVSRLRGDADLLCGGSCEEQ